MEEQKDKTQQLGIKVDRRYLAEHYKYNLFMDFV